MPVEKELRTLAESLYALKCQSDNDPNGHHWATVPRRRGIRSSKRNVARRLEVSLVTQSRPTGHDGGGGAPKQDLWRRPLDPALEAMERDMRTQEGVRPESIGVETPTTCQVRWRSRFEGKGKEQRQKNKRGIRKKAGRLVWTAATIPGVVVWLTVTTRGTLPDDRLCIGRTRSVPSGPRGWSNPWNVLWKGYRCLESQPCHGDVIVRAFAEAKSEARWSSTTAREPRAHASSRSGCLGVSPQMVADLPV